MTSAAAAAAEPGLQHGLELAALTFAGVVGGLLNTAASGGSLLSFLALTSLGMPPLVAHATNLTATPASFAAVPHKTLRDPLGRRLIVPACLGTALGAGLLALLTDQWFRAAVPWALLLAAALLAIQPWAGRWMPSMFGRRPSSMLGCGLYAGTIGAGVSTLVLLALGGTGPRDVLTKNVVCLATAITGAAALTVASMLRPGLIDWATVAVLGAGMAAGGALGTRLVSRMTKTVLRHGVVLTSIASATWLLTHS